MNMTTLWFLDIKIFCLP